MVLYLSSTMLPSLFESRSLHFTKIGEGVDAQHSVSCAFACSTIRAYRVTVWLYRGRAVFVRMRAAFVLRVDPVSVYRIHHAMARPATYAGRSFSLLSSSGWIFADLLSFFSTAILTSRD
jgi:hypothetical protein